MNRSKPYKKHHQQELGKWREQNNSGVIQLFIGSLPARCKEDDLRQLLRPYGKLTSINLFIDFKTVLCKGFGNVTLKIHQKARLDNAKIVEKLLKTPFNLKGRKIHIERFLKGDQLENRNQALSGRRIFLKNLPKKIKNSDLVSLFSRFGEVHCAYCIKSATGRNMPYGYVNFMRRDATEAALRQGIIFLMGRRIYIYPYKQRNFSGKSGEEQGDMLSLDDDENRHRSLNDNFSEEQSFQNPERRFNYQEIEGDQEHFDSFNQYTFEKQQNFDSDFSNSSRPYFSAKNYTEPFSPGVTEQNKSENRTQEFRRGWDSKQTPGSGFRSQGKDGDQNQERGNISRYLQSQRAKFQPNNSRKDESMAEDRFFFDHQKVKNEKFGSANTMNQQRFGKRRERTPIPKHSVQHREVDQSSKLIADLGVVKNYRDNEIEEEEWGQSRVKLSQGIRSENFRGFDQTYLNPSQKSDHEWSAESSKNKRAGGLQSTHLQSGRNISPEAGRINLERSQQKTIGLGSMNENQLNYPSGFDQRKRLPSSHFQAANRSQISHLQNLSLSQGLRLGHEDLDFNSGFNHTHQPNPFQVGQTNYEANTMKYFQPVHERQQINNPATGQKQLIREKNLNKPYLENEQVFNSPKFYLQNNFEFESRFDSQHLLASESKSVFTKKGHPSVALKNISSVGRGFINLKNLSPEADPDHIEDSREIQEENYYLRLRRKKLFNQRIHYCYPENKKYLLEGHKPGKRGYLYQGVQANQKKKGGNLRLLTAQK